MTITTLTLTNPGAEAGATTGWTVYSGGAAFTAIAGGHSGSYEFRLNGLFSATTIVGQQVAVPAASEAAVDAYQGAFQATVWGYTGNDSLAIRVDCYASDGTTLIESFTYAPTETASYTQRQVTEAIPVNTRFLRIGAEGHRSGSSLDVRFDDFQLDFSDSKNADYPGVFEPHVSQLGTYALATAPTEELQAVQLPIIAVSAAETSSGNFQMFAHQLGAYALVRDNGDRRELRAWTFKQDDHEFYGIQLGSEGTLVWDKLTNMWCQWKSPGYAYWRAEDVVDWEGYNLAGDTETGKIWRIDPTGRLDYGTTPIISKIVGYITHRMRTIVSCFMAELAVSEGEPPTGFDDGSVGITLRTSTDNGQTFTSHGEVTGEGIGEDITVRWYGLGTMTAPGMLFEITDSGYARRVDGLDIETTE